MISYSSYVLIVSNSGYYPSWRCCKNGTNSNKVNSTMIESYLHLSLLLNLF